MFSVTMEKHKRLFTHTKKRRKRMKSILVNVESLLYHCLIKTSFSELLEINFTQSQEISSKCD